MQLASVGFTQTASPNRIDICLAESQHRAPFTFHYLLPTPFHCIAAAHEMRSSSKLNQELQGPSPNGV